MRSALEMLTVPGKCVGCGECVTACPQAALRLDPGGPARRDDLCTTCGHCAEVCPALAHEAVGRRWSVDEVMTEIRKEMPFFVGTQGGVTLSGGEPLAQPEFVHAVLVACGLEGVHRAVDTSGYAPWPIVERIAAHTDVFLYDLKHMDTHIHQQVTGVGNGLILANLTRLAQAGARVIVRLPLIAGINDDADNLARTADFVAALPGIPGIDVLAYHATARSKYAKLGREYPGAFLQPVAQEQIDAAVTILQQRGLRVRLGG